MERGFAIHDPAVARHREERVDHSATVGAFSRVAYAIFRIGAGLLFMEHGLQKLFGAFGGFGGTPGATVPLMSKMGFAGLIEVVGGAMIVLGLLTRPVALVLVIEMLYAYFTVHAHNGPWPIQNQGELALLYALTFLFLLGHGGGPASVDRKLGHHNL